MPARRASSKRTPESTTHPSPLIGPTVIRILHKLPRINRLLFSNRLKTLTTTQFIPVTGVSDLQPQTSNLQFLIGSPVIRILHKLLRINHLHFSNRRKKGRFACRRFLPGARLESIRSRVSNIRSEIRNHTNPFRIIANSFSNRFKTRLSTRTKEGIRRSSLPGVQSPCNHNAVVKSRQDHERRHGVGADLSHDPQSVRRPHSQYQY
jgi:hypothetical protein